MAARPDGVPILLDRSQAMTAFEIELAVERLGGITWDDPICLKRPRPLSAGNYHATDATWDVVRRHTQLNAILRNVMNAAEANSLRWQVLDVRRQSQVPKGERIL